MKLSAIHQPIRSATIELGDDQSFTIKFRSLSPAEWDRLEEETKGKRWSIVLQLAYLLVETGFEDGDGNPIAPTEENLFKIDAPVLKAMLAATWGATLPKKEI